jgi:hypothetical protein
MTKDSVVTTFFYNAQGHALSGHLCCPVEHVIEVQAGISLPTIGGYGSSCISNFCFQHFVSFTKAYTHVSGGRDEKDGSFNTLATSTIEGLNILDVVTADRVVARMASERGPNMGDPSHILFLGSNFQNLRIAGCPVDVEMNHDLSQRIDTFESFEKELKSNTAFRKMTEDPFHTGRKSSEREGVVICSLVKDMETTCAGIKRVGHGFEVPQFGKVYLAEVLLGRCKRTLTMLRLELGCTVCGQMVMAQVQGNGQPWH